METQIITAAIHCYSQIVTTRLNETNPELNNEFSKNYLGKCQVSILSVEWNEYILLGWNCALSQHNLKHKIGTLIFFPAVSKGEV